MLYIPTISCMGFECKFENSRAAVREVCSVCLELRRNSLLNYVNSRN